MHKYRGDFMFNIDRFEELIKETGVSKTSICNKLGRTRSFFVDVKKGKQSPKPGEIPVIADCLNCDADYLLGKTDIKKVPVESDKGDHDALEREFVELLKRLTPEQKKAVAAFIHALSDKE